MTGARPLAASALVQQRWSITHRGHRIDYSNNPIRRGRLRVDGKSTSKGQIGVHSMMRVPIKSGDGRGDLIPRALKPGCLVPLHNPGGTALTATLGGVCA